MLLLILIALPRPPSPPVWRSKHVSKDLISSPIHPSIFDIVNISIYIYINQTNQQEILLILIILLLNHPTSHIYPIYPIHPYLYQLKKEHDFGLPSAHSMSALSLILYLVLYLRKIGALEIDGYVIGAMVWWVGSVCLSST